MVGKKSPTAISFSTRSSAALGLSLKKLTKTLGAGPSRLTGQAAHPSFLHHLLHARQTASMRRFFLHSMPLVPDLWGILSILRGPYMQHN